MIAYPDTSFLFSLYLPRPSSAVAARAFAKLPGPLPVTTLLLFEFENSLRVAAWLNGRDRFAGIKVQAAETALARVESDIEGGVLDLMPCDLGAIVALARKISSSRTWKGGHRSFDLLHIAAARHLKAKEFLSFDARQRGLAVAEGLRVGPDSPD